MRGWLKSLVERWGIARLVVVAVMASLGLVVAVLGTVAAIKTWIDVVDAQMDFRETLRRAERRLEDLGATSAAAVSRRAQIERELEAQGIELVEVDGDAGPEFLKHGDQLVELPEPVQIPEPPTFLEEAGGQILVAVSGALIAGGFLVWATLIGRTPKLDEATERRLTQIESQLAQTNEQSAPT
jgi:hypothetical protein